MTTATTTDPSPPRAPESIPAFEHFNAEQQAYNRALIQRFRERGAYRWQACGHESSHGVVAIALGLPLSTIAIFDDPTHAGGALGVALLSRSALTVSREDLQAHARDLPVARPLTALGYPLTEFLIHVLAGPSFDEAWQSSGHLADLTAGRDDLACARSLLSQAFRVDPASSDVTRGVAQYRAFASQILHTRRAWIEATALELYDQRRLTGDDVRNLKR